VQWIAFVCVCLAPDARAQTEAPGSGVEIRSPALIGGLELQDEALLKFRPELEVVFHGYYTAVELGDFDWALAYYAWNPVNKMKREEREAALENARDAARLVKAQIEHNGGVRSVAVQGIFQRDGLGPVAVVEVEFNNGVRDLSPAVAMIYEGERERERPSGGSKWSQ